MHDLDLCYVCIAGFLMGNLMVCDLILGALIPLSIHTLLAGEWQLGAAGCTISGFCVTVANCAANWALCLVSVERYFAILYPFRHSLYVQYIKYISIILWFFVVAHNCVMLQYQDAFILIEDMYMCGPNMADYPIYIVLLNIFDLLLPNFIIVYTYIKIHREVQRHNKEIAVNTLRSNSTKGDDLDTQAPAEWKAALVIIAIVGVFNVCWVPFGIGMMAYAFQAPMPYGIAASLFWIALTQAGVNPLVYTILNRTYRKEMVRMIKCQLPIQREISAVSL